jgi:yeast amino acid transporter
MTWNYILQWWGTLPLEISAAAITLQYWDASLQLPGFVTLFLGFVAFVNLVFGTRGYGESEVFFSFLKASAVVIFILLTICVDLGAGPHPHYYGTTTWRHPGAFYNGFRGFLGMFTNAAFAYSGTELVGLAAAECHRPHKVMPMASKQVVWRIVFFYLISLLCVGFIVPYTNPNLLGGGSDVNTSAFVVAADMAGIKGFADFMNFIILISTLSVGNSSVYGASRTVLAVVEHGQAPKWLGYKDRQGRPIVAMVITLLFGLIAYVDTNTQQSVKCFNWLLAISGLAVLFTWGSILLAHIRFRAAWVYQGHTIEELPFQAQFGVEGSYIGLFLIICALLATFYTALYPIHAYPAPPVGTDDASLNPYNFFSVFLAAPVVLVCTFIKWLYDRIMDPHQPFCDLVPLEKINLLDGLNKELPTLDQLRVERAAESCKPWIVQAYNIVFS